MPPSDVLPDEDPNDKTAESAIEQQPESNPSETTPEDLGGHLNEDGKFETDFGDILDKSMKKVEAAPRDESGKFTKSDGEKKPDGAEAAEAESETAEKLVEAKKIEDAGGVEKKEPDAAKPDASTDRDADLKELESKLDPHASPKTKNHFKAQQQAVIDARNAADKAAAEAKAARDELAAAKAAGVPKEVDEELKQLRDTVRELDASRDPTLKAKYDKKITGNDDAIMGILQQNGYGKDKDGKEIPGVVDALKKAGLNRKTLEAHITALEKAGEHESAEEIKDLLRENTRLSKDKEREVGEFKATFEQRQQQAQTQEQQRLEQANKRMVSEFKSHADKFDFLQPPPSAKPEDPPAVKKEKDRAITAFNERVLKLGEAIKKETASPEDAQISARVGILYRDHVLPHVQGQLEAMKKEAEGLRAQIKAMKGAGSLGEKVGAGKPASAPKQDEDTTGSSFDEIVDKIARSSGVLK